MQTISQQSDINALLASMTVASNVTETPFNAMFYGDYGAGKTTLAAQLLVALSEPEKGRDLILSIETRQGASLSLNNVSGDVASRTLRVPYTSFEDLEVLVKMIALRQDPTLARVSGIMLDEASTMLYNEVNRVHEYRKANGLLARNELEANGLASDTPTRETYNATSVRWRDLVDILVNIPNLNVFFIAHEKSEKQGANNQVSKIRPNIPEVALGKIATVVNLIAHVTSTFQNIGGNASHVREVRVHGTDYYTTKTDIPFDKQLMPAEHVVPWVMNWRSAKQAPPVAVAVPQEQTSTDILSEFGVN